MVSVQQEPVLPERLIEKVRCPQAGAVELFLGIVRDHNKGRRVLFMEYEAFGPMAVREIKRIREEALGRFDIHRVAVSHRTGRLEIGEIAVCIAVSSSHRADAREACRFIIDSLKETVPIWKKEHFENGAAWL